MMINNLSDVVGSVPVSAKSDRPVADGVGFAATLEKTIASTVKKAADAERTNAQPQTEVDTAASALLADPQNGLDTALEQAGQDKSDDQKDSQDTAFIDPQIQQLQQILTQTPPVCAESVTTAVQEPSTALTVETAAAVDMPASGPLAQPIFLDNRKGGASHATNVLASDRPQDTSSQADLNAGNKTDLFSSVMSGKKTESIEGKLPESVGQNGGTAMQSLSKEPDMPLFHHAMVESAKASAQPEIAVTETTPTSGGALNEELGTPAWQQSLGQQISMFTRNGIHNAELRLHPEELGALQINLRLNNDHAQLHFVTENYQVRAAIEAAMPHLRSSLAESGIQLGQSSVGADASSSGGFSEQAKQPQHAERAGELTQANEDVQEVQTRVIHRREGINTFA